MEIEHDSVRRDGFFFDGQIFRRDLYRLLAAFFATSDYARLSRNIDTESVAALAEEFQEDEISRLLVGIATTVRVIQDRETRPALLMLSVCGKFYPSFGTSKAVEALTLREACNKILHARKFNFDAKPLPKSERGLPYPTYSLRPFLHLYGKQGNAGWKAELNIVRFVRANAILIRG